MLQAVHTAPYAGGANANNTEDDMKPKKLTSDQLKKRLRDMAKSAVSVDSFISDATKYAIPPMTLTDLKEEFGAYGVNDLTDYYAAVQAEKQKAV